MVKTKTYTMMPLIMVKESRMRVPVFGAGSQRLTRLGGFRRLAKETYVRHQQIQPRKVNRNTHPIKGYGKHENGMGSEYHEKIQGRVLRDRSQDSREFEP